MGDLTVNEFLYKPNLGDYGIDEKLKFDLGMDQLDARLGKEFWAGDPKLGGGVDPITRLRNAISKIGTNSAILRVPAETSPYSVTTNLVIPQNIHLKLEKGAIFYIADGVTLTLNCSIEAGPYQIFSWAGKGKVILGKGCTSEIPVRWWGAKGDGVTNDTAAIQAAINAMATKGATLVGSPIDEYLVDTLVFDASGAGSLSLPHLWGKGAKLRQNGTGDILRVDAADHLVINDWYFIGKTGARNGSAIKVNEKVVKITIRDCRIRNFDKGLHFIYTLYNHVSDCEIQTVNNAIYVQQGLGTSNVNRFTNCKAMYCYDTAVYIEVAGQIIIDTMAIEGAYKNAIHIKNTNQVNIRGLHVEAIGGDQDVSYPYAILLDNCRNVNIESSSIQLGTPHQYTSMFRLINGCKGFHVSKSNLYFPNGGSGAYCSLYSSDGTAINVVIEDNYMTGTGPTTGDLHSIALFRRNSTDVYRGFVMPATLVKSRKLIGSMQYSNLNPTFAYHPTPKENIVSSNATWILDTTTGVDDNNSFKITWTGASPYMRLGMLTAKTTAAKTGVMSFYFKTDTDQYISVSCLNGGGSSYLPAKGDGIWRYCALLTSPDRTDQSSMIRIDSSASNGNFWIDNVSLLWFDTASEANDWVGYHPVEDLGGIRNITATDTAPDVLTPYNQKGVFQTANTSSTVISKFTKGRPGQEISVLIKDANTTISQWGGNADYLYNYNYTAHTWSANGATAQNWDFFADNCGANDCIYWGSINHKFCGLKIKIYNSFTAAAVTFAWEYWNGTTWSALAVSDQLILTQVAGEHTLSWIPPIDWRGNPAAPASPFLCYWIRCRIISVTSPTEGGRNAYLTNRLAYLKLNNMQDFGPISSGQTGIITFINDGVWYEKSRILE